MDSLSIQNGQLILHVAKPHATKTIGEFGYHACLWQVVAASKRCPHAIRQSVQAMPSEGKPQAAHAVRSNCLQKPDLISHLLGNFNWHEFAMDEMPKTSDAPKPEGFVRCAVGTGPANLAPANLAHVITRVGFSLRNMVKLGKSPRPNP